MENLLVKQFQENNITIYGTSEKPLFKAKDIGDLLGIKNIRDTVSKFDEEFVFKSNVGITDVGNSSNTWFLTIQGVYEVLFITRKPLAKEFRKWVSFVLEEIRKTGEYKSNKQFEQKTKNTLFIEQFQNKPILYLGMVEDREEQQIVKYGYTQDIKSTLKRHQESYGEEFHYIYSLECKEHYNLENKIQKHNDLSSRHVKKYNDRDRQELLRLDKNFNIKNLIELVVKLKEEIENDTTLRLREIDLLEAQEKTSQEKEKTKQLQLELEILKLKSSSPDPPTSQPPVIRTTVRQHQQPQENIELVKKFMNLKTEFSTKRSDYVFIEDLFNIFEDWVQENNSGCPVSIGKATFSRCLSSTQDYIIVRVATGPRVSNFKPRKVAIVNCKLI
jgi:prophage antirepressor-like protein